MIESSRAYGRGCLLGIATYLRLHGPFEILHLERSLDQGMPSEVQKWQPDGIVARIDTTALWQSVNGMNVPVVDLLGTYEPPQGAIIRTDDDACAAQAIAHLCDRGFHHFAFCGYSGIDWSDRREAAFVNQLSERGYAVHRYGPHAGGRRSGYVIYRERSGEFDETELAQWLATLPQPLGIFACNDVRGRQVLHACVKAGLTVPDQVAVVGVDNDHLLCELSSQPLSSIEPDSERLGYEGIARLHRIIKGDRSEPPLVTYPPKRVVKRRSSDVVAVDDVELAAALQLIRDHACDGMTVADVVKQVPLSRPTLQRRFWQKLGRSPKQQIDQVRIDRAKRLLIETDYTLKHIAYLTGFSNAAHFATMFKRHTGQSPKAFASFR
jgi:LacI family transcriptional regulator